MAKDDPLDLTAHGPQYSFLANAPAGSPLSYQSLVTRRKIAEALLGKRDRLPFPKNPGEGLAYASEKLGDAFVDRKMLDELDTAERRQALGEAALRYNFDNPPSAAGTPASTQTSLQTSASPTVGNTGVTSAPYVPSSPDSVPLPRARPTMDYSKSIAELEADPETAAQAAAMTLGERNLKAPRGAVQSQYASLFNRAQAHGMTVKEALNNGYYPPDALARGRAQLQTPEQVAAFRRDIADPVLSGAGDPAGLGFFPTQNASGGVAERGIVPPPGGGPPRYNISGRVPGDTETFAQKPGEGAALERFRNPFGPPAVPDTQTAAVTPPGAPPGSRDAITADMMSSTPLAQQQPFGAPPAAPAVPSPATPPVQTATLGGAGGLTPGPGAPGSLMAGAAPMLPAGFTPPVPPGPVPASASGPGPGPTVALPPNPITPTDVMPRPVQTAQAQPIVPPGTLPSKSPMLPDVPLELPEQPGPQPKPPPIPQPTAKMRQLSDIATSGNVTPQLQDWAKARYGDLEKQQTRQYEQDLNQYHFDRGDWDKKDENYKKAVREAPLQAIDRRIKLLSIEKAAADENQRPLEVARIEAQIASERAKFVELQQKIYGPVEKDIRGTIYQRQPFLPQGTPLPGGGVAGAPGDLKYSVAPGAPPPKEETTEQEAKAKVFIERGAPEIRRLREMNNGKAMTYFKEGQLIGRLPFGLDNALVSNQYRRANASFMNFGTELMTYLSGSAYGEKEMERTLAPFKPTFGDTDRDLADKMERAETMIKSVGYMAPEQARTAVEQANFNYGASKPIAKGLTADQIRDLGPGRKYLAPDNKIHQVPIERIRP